MSSNLRLSQHGLFHQVKSALSLLKNARADGGCESISVVPNKLKGNCEVLLLVLSALDGDTGKTDLTCAAGLSFKVASIDDEDKATEIAGGSLQQLLAASQQADSTEGLQSLVVCAMQRTADGWVANFCLQPLPACSWGRCVPQLRQLLTELPGFPADRLIASAPDEQPPKPAAEEVEAEVPEVQEPEWRCSMLDAQGEEVQAVSSKSKEAEGVSGLSEPEEAAAEDAEGAPIAPSPAVPKDPFPLKDSIIIDLEALPQGVRHIAILISNSAEGGLQAVQSSHIRISDATSSVSAQQPSLGWLCFPGPPASKASNLMLCKLHKESTTSAFAVWRSTQTASIPALVEGDDVPQEARDSVAAGFRWRIRCTCEYVGSNPAEELQDELKRTIGFYGRLDGNGQRQDGRAYSLYPNGDSYFGSYATDAREGMGLYATAVGGAHAGLWSAAKRAGQGMMLMPDGALYTGSFQADKFDGLGTYSYPAGSTYNGSWKGGKKHGQGVMLDTAGGRLDGTWEGGIQAGPAMYTQKGFQFSGGFQQGLPSGPCSFALAATASQGLPPPAAAHLRILGTPTLRSVGAYNFTPSGTASGEGDEEGDNASPKLPSFPDFEGLLYRAGASLPQGVAELSYGPELQAPVQTPA
ncbi:hypothetical protein WJX74_009340 [Apatococcus lobatus]|uniref:Uncharacterized protein n=1 Tax=Apatococcus lobatus TaxID=904363 RepID=A0AAW1RIN3_9CHLO